MAAAEGARRFDTVAGVESRICRLEERARSRSDRIRKLTEALTNLTHQSHRGAPERDSCAPRSTHNKETTGLRALPAPCMTIAEVARASQEGKLLFRSMRLPDKQLEHPPYVNLRSVVPQRKSDGFWTVRVFISSTFLDMHAERDTLMRHVLPELNARLRPHRVRCVFVDLRWGLTEEGAHELGALEASLRGLEACNNVVLHLVSDRFGWDQGTTPKSEGGEGLPYKLLEPGAEMYDQELHRRFEWIQDPSTPRGLSVTAAEMGHALGLYTDAPPEPVHAIVLIR